MLVHQTGLTLHNREKATPSYTLYAPSWGDTAFLIDLEGNEVNRWQLSAPGNNQCEMLPNGNFFVSERMSEGPPLGPGKGGRLREYDWDGNVVWEHVDIDQHHDSRRLANGGTAYIAWYAMAKELHAQVKGGIPGSEHHQTGEIYGDAIRELDASGDVVFEWRSEELDFDKYPICPLCNREEYAHANTISPMPNGDYLVSFRVLNLLVIIDRQTGRVKWEHHDLMMGHQHDCQMIENGNILVYANGYHTPIWTYSAALEINPDSHETVWKFDDPTNKASFFSPHISGVQRLSSGNTLICEGAAGCIFEVTPEGEVVWEFVSPHVTHHAMAGNVRWVFRARRYAADSPEIQNRV